MNAPARMPLNAPARMPLNARKEKARLLCRAPYIFCFASGAVLKSRANNRSGGVAGTGAHGNQLNAGRSGASLWNVFRPIRAEILEELVRTEDVVICDFWFI